MDLRTLSVSYIYKVKQTKRGSMVLGYLVFIEECKSLEYIIYSRLHSWRPILVWCVYCYSLMYDHVLILLFQTGIWMLFHVFISPLWFLCIHINFYKSCSVSILDMCVWQMHFEHSLWQRFFFMYDEIFVSLLLSLLSLIHISLEVCYFLCLDSGLLSFRPTILSTYSSKH